MTATGVSSPMEPIGSRPLVAMETKYRVKSSFDQPKATRNRESNPCSGNPKIPNSLRSDFLFNVVRYFFSELE